MGTATVTEDVVLTAVGLLALALACLVLHVVGSTVRALLPGRPPLPEDDRAPSGLGRLVPVGAQVEHEVRAGRAALELWLSTALRSGQAAAGARGVPAQRSAPSQERLPSGRSTRPAPSAADGAEPPARPADAP